MKLVGGSRIQIDNEWLVVAKIEMEEDVEGKVYQIVLVSENKFDADYGQMIAEERAEMYGRRQIEIDAKTSEHLLERTRNNPGDSDLFEES